MKQFNAEFRLPGVPGHIRMPVHANDRQDAHEFCKAFAEHAKLEYTGLETVDNETYAG